MTLNRNTATEETDRGDQMACLQITIETETNGRNRLGERARTEAPQMETESPKTPEPLDNATLKRSTFGRGKPKTTGDRPSPGSPLETSGKIPTLDDNMGPLTINTGHMTETEIRQAIQDAKTVEQELFIRVENGQVGTH